MGIQDVTSPNKRLGIPFQIFGRPKLNLKETAKSQIEALGYTADDVRHIVVTHMDLDHGGGIEDFPLASIHTHEKEWEEVQKKSKHLSRERYRNINTNWNVTTHKEEGDRWYGFDLVRPTGSERERYSPDTSPWSFSRSLWCCGPESGQVDFPLR